MEGPTVIPVPKEANMVHRVLSFHGIVDLQILDDQVLRLQGVLQDSAGGFHVAGGSARFLSPGKLGLRPGPH